MSEIIPVIDAHCHVFPDAIAGKSRDAVRDFYELPMYTSGTAAHLQQERTRIISVGGKPYQIVRQLICAPAVTPHQSESINRFIAALVRDDPALLGFGTVHPAQADAAAVIGTFRVAGLRGIKLHSDFQRCNIDDPAAYPIYEEATRLGLPVLFHMGDRKLDFSHPRRLQRVLTDFPHLIAIAAHTGGYSHWNEALDLLTPSDRLYFDISSTLQMMDGTLLRAFLERFGETHFFFGSDFPMWDPAGELERLLSFGYPESTVRRLLTENFLRFYAVT